MCALRADLVEPTAKAGSTLKSVTVFQNAEKNLLHEVFTGFVIAGEMQEKTEEGLGMAVKEQGELAHIAVANLLHDQIVFHSLGITPGRRKGYRDFLPDL